MQRSAVALGIVLASLACAADEGEVASPGPAMASGDDGGERARMLGPFLDAHWRLPVPLQGDPPAGFSTAEAGLDPASCAPCHPKQHAEWSGSLHAGAYSPGFAGQLVEGSLAAPGQVRHCQTCHAPLEEQQPFDAAHETNAHYDAGLRAGGIVCAACHVRGHRRFGPARRDDAPPVAEPPPHAGFEARPEYQESRFCAPCHQFFDEEPVNGKPLENTFVEWQASPQAAAGRTCQSCHMPDRAHLWRGIHDPEMVRAAVDVDLVADDRDGGQLSAALVVRNRDVGHAFPTYVTPRVFLAVWQEDADGRELQGTRRDATLGREIDFGSWTERFDTRVLPGESARLDYGVPRHTEATRLVGRVTVDPDFHYRGVFATLLESYSSAEALAAIREAHERTQRSRYDLAVIRRPL